MLLIIWNGDQKVREIALRARTVLEALSEIKPEHLAGGTEWQFVVA